VDQPLVVCVADASEDPEGDEICLFEGEASLGEQTL
jgi:hypothetical protein